jgi:hypothetical protein
MAGSTTPSLFDGSPTSRELLETLCPANVCTILQNRRGVGLLFAIWLSGAHDQNGEPECFGVWPVNNPSFLHLFATEEEADDFLWTL